MLVSFGAHLYVVGSYDSLCFACTCLSDLALMDPSVSNWLVYPFLVRCSADLLDIETDFIAASDYLVSASHATLVFLVSVITSSPHCLISSFTKFLPLFVCNSMNYSLTSARTPRRMFNISTHPPCSSVPSGKCGVSFCSLCILLILMGN